MKPVTLVLSTLLFIFMGGLYNPVHACEQWQAKIDRVNAHKRKGGNAKQVNRWNKERKYYAEQYYECQREKPRIHTASKRTSSNRKVTVSAQPVRVSQSNNPATQQLLATCNFWITTTNRQPTNDNENFRNTACAAFEQSERNPPPISATPNLQRNVSTCIKAGNLLDDEVHACMKGELDPYWRTD
jgi:hypothetical protein